MTTIVTDAGFAADDWNRGYAKPNAAANDALALHLEPDTDPDQVPLSPGLEMIRVNFPSFSDGRGFSIARQLRLRGFAGRLRACGHVLADQYAMARRSGFDEVEIDDDLAARQPEDQWLARANWRDHDYQSRLRG
ncbi:DUF934 domain-containing protein [Sedimentitalea sp. JM2-8]|uniref:DUF934 domain-containing protein n=1 Tax=Sedimentitalea xiamensis TaxID=3050037 RepID=A0ABT7FAB2_9RHOB|nr:DUF934 domain-containing protein [Sedimentitalea xiamensis]MDK3072036.1 DUF934 domain-containing protein [Sedimentitalea xiamensis]